MICVTGSEASPEALRERQRLASRADLHELRLDLLDDPTVPVSSLAERPLTKLVVTCRPVRCGGGFQGEEGRRLSLLRNAVVAGVGFVDVESDVDETAAEGIFDAAAGGQTRIIRSFHGWELMSGQEMADSMERLRVLRGHILKLAVMVDDAADLETLFRLGTKRDRPVVLIGLGRAGVLSRLCYRRFKSAWTFVAADASTTTALGQITWQQTLDWGFEAGADPSPIALLGGSQIHRSPGPDVYNRLFARSGARHVYVAVETRRLRQTWSLLRELGVRGASVTMPHKGEAVSLVDEVDATCGAINTIWRSKGRFRAKNTDGVGALQAIEPVISVVGARALVMGAGGTGRAVAASLVERGASVCLWNRTPDRARALAETINQRGSPPRVAVVEELEPSSFDLVVNATSVGLAGRNSLIDDERELRGVVVLDCVSMADETPLMKLVRSGGGVAVSGREMWLHQGAAQASLWLNCRVEADELRELLERALTHRRPWTIDVV